MLNKILCNIIFYNCIVNGILCSNINSIIIVELSDSTINTSKIVQKNTNR